MAEQSAARVPSAPFPAPPPFYKHFTKQNVAKLRELRKEAAKNKVEGPEGSAQQPEIDVLSLPPELRFLVPPEPPADGHYRSFGVEHDLAQPSQSLEAAGVPQLYPANAADSEHFDPTIHLTTLTRAILHKFLELVGVMGINPTQGPECIEDLQTMFFNVHDLINRYRPHQARESLILMMEGQIEKIKAETAKIKEVKEQKLAGILSDMQKLQDVSSNAIEPDNAKATVKEDAATAAERARKEVQKRMWEALDTELGD